MSSGVEFEEDVFAHGSPRPQSSSGAPLGQSSAQGQELSNVVQEGGMAGWLIRHHLAKSPEIAQFVMLGIVVINITIVIIALVFFL